MFFWCSFQEGKCQFCYHGNDQKIIQEQKSFSNNKYHECKFEKCQTSGTHNSKLSFKCQDQILLVICAIKSNVVQKMMDCLKRVHQARWLISKKSLMI